MYSTKRKQIRPVNSWPPSYSNLIVFKSIYCVLTICPALMVSVGASKIKKPHSALRGSQLKERAHSLCSQYKSSHLVSSLLIFHQHTVYLFVFSTPRFCLCFPLTADIHPVLSMWSPRHRLPYLITVLRERGGIPPQRKGFPSSFFCVLVCFCPHHLELGLTSRKGWQNTWITGEKQELVTQVFHRLGNQIPSERTSPFISRNIWFGRMHLVICSPL